MQSQNEAFREPIGSTMLNPKELTHDSQLQLLKKSRTSVPRSALIHKTETSNNDNEKNNANSFTDSKHDEGKVVMDFRPESKMTHLLASDPNEKQMTNQETLPTNGVNASALQMYDPVKEIEESQIIQLNLLGMETKTFDLRPKTTEAKRKKANKSVNLLML